MSRIKTAVSVYKFMACKHPHIVALEAVACVAIIVGLLPSMPFLPCLGIAAVAWLTEAFYLTNIK